MSSDTSPPAAPKPRPNRRLVLRPVRRPYPRCVAAARALCEPLGMMEPRDIDVEALAHRAGANVVMAHPLVQGEGHTLRERATGRGLVAIAERFWSVRHGRFVLAHEIGHLLLHAANDVLPACLDGGAPLAKGGRTIEAEATDAGCEILMPEGWFAPGCRGDAPGVREIVDLADRFRVDVAAAALRALLYVERPCAMVVATSGVVAWVACSEGWDLYLRRKVALPEGSAAAAAAGDVLDGATCDANVWGGRGGSEQEREALPPVEGAVREFVHRDAKSGSAVIWLVREG